MVLPTDERFMKLSEVQKNLLFVGYLSHPTSEQLHTANYSTPEAAITDKDVERFSKLGYSAEQIERMRQQLEAARRG